MSQKIQMVNGKTYTHPGVNGGNAVTLGMVVTVDDDAVAESVLNDVFLDGVDKECPYFAVYDKDDAATVEDGDSKPVSNRRAPARRTSK